MDVHDRHSLGPVLVGLKWSDIAVSSPAQDPSQSGCVPAEQAERLRMLEALELSAGQRVDQTEETTIIECAQNEAV